MSVLGRRLAFCSLTVVMAFSTAAQSSEPNAAPPSTTHDADEQAIITAARARADVCSAGDVRSWATFIDAGFRNIEGNDIQNRNDLSGLCHNAARAIPGHRLERQLSEFHFQFVGNVALVDYLYDIKEYYGEAVLGDPIRRFEAFEKRHGRWVALVAVSAAVIPDPPVATVDADKLEDFVGQYTWPGSGFVDTVVRKGDRLYVQGTDQDSPTEMLPEKADTFFFRGGGVGHDSRVTFVRGQSGRVIEERVFSPVDGHGFSAKKTK